MPEMRRPTNILTETTSPSEELLTWPGAEAYHETRFHRSVARVDRDRAKTSLLDDVDK